MTNSQAKSELMQIYMSLSEEKKKALDMAIKALEYDDAKYHEEHGEVVVDKAVWEDAKRALEQEPSGDAVKQAIRDVLQKLEYEHKEYAADSEYMLALWDVANEIRLLPSVKPQEPKTGHWIIIDDCEKFIAKCSECGQIEDSRMIGKYAYCHCGARMESEI